MKALKVAGLISSVILFVYAILLIGQIWGDWMKWSDFIKLTITAGAIIATVVIIALIYKELVEEKELKKDNFLD